jgi:hypothetical protein
MRGGSTFHIVSNHPFEILVISTPLHASYIP